MPDGAPSWFKSVLRKPQATTNVAQDAAVAEAPAAEPFSLARRIQALIHKLPTPSPSTTAASTSTQENHDEHESQGLPSSSLTDQEIVEALRSPVMMNGSLDDRRTSVWNMLDGIGSPRPPRVAELSQNDTASDTFSDSSSVMVYSPLLPVQGSLVELAESEVIIEEQEEEEEEEAGTAEQGLTPAPAPIPGWSWANTLPTSFTSWFVTQSTQQPIPPPPRTEEGQPPMSPRTRVRRVRAQRAWVPSKDKLSIQCMWWGYRMYLPPPVLDILDDKQLEAARRTAMITTALTWFFNNLPVNTLPLPLRPTLFLLQQIGPFLGSIGTFISWSWGAIRAYDQGYGVTLTATWLLPIALIPGTWFERDWPISPPPPDFSPLPSIDSILQPSHATSTNTGTSHSNFLPTPESTPTPRVNQLELPPSSPQFTPRGFADAATSLPPNGSYIYQSPPTSPYSQFTSSPLAASTPLPPGTPYILSPPTFQPSTLPSPASVMATPLLPSTSYVVHSPPPTSLPISPYQYPNSLYPVSSPTTSFATAPSSPVPPSSPPLPRSPAPSSPKRFRTGLASLVAKSPTIRVRKSKRAASSPLAPSSSSSPVQGHPSTDTSYQSFSAYSPIVSASTPLPYHQHNSSHAFTSDHLSSFTAHPDDIRLLQSPVWQCSPLPPEHPLHDDL